jgi:hypothetical protein
MKSFFIHNNHFVPPLLDFLIKFYDAKNCNKEKRERHTNQGLTIDHKDDLV